MGQNRDDEQMAAVQHFIDQGGEEGIFDRNRPGDLRLGGGACENELDGNAGDENASDRQWSTSAIERERLGPWALCPKAMEDLARARTTRGRHAHALGFQ